MMAGSPTSTREQEGEARHVLVVDDEDDVREVVCTTLRLIAGWRVTEASSGEQALELAAADVPDAVLLDVMMPGMSGNEVLERLRDAAATRDVPVILMTARVGFDAANIISKPFDPLLLPERIRQILDVAARATDSDQQSRARISLVSAWARRRSEVLERVTRLHASLYAAEYFRLGTRGHQQIVEELHALIGVAGAFGFDAAAQIGRSAHDLVIDRADKLGESDLMHLRSLIGQMLAAFGDS